MNNDDQLQPRDKLLRDTFTPAETALFITLLGIGTVAFWVGVPRSTWLLGALLIVGCLSPLILKLHEHTHPFFVDHLWRKFWLLTAPGWLAATLHLLGLPQDPLLHTVFNGTPLIVLREVNNLLPVTTGGNAASLSVAAHVAILLIAVMVFIIPKSRAFFERLMPWLCLSAVSVALFGYLQIALGLDAPLFSPGTGRSDFFAYFPYDGHWAAFATLWACACFAMALLTMRYEDSPPFIETAGPFYLVGGLVLGASGLTVQAHGPSIVLLATTALMLLIVALRFIREQKDPHRGLLASLCGLGALVFFMQALLRFLQSGDATPGRALLQDSAWRLFSERPIFGSGMDSFGRLLPFYGSDRLHGQPFTRAGSDLPHMLAEFGLAGAVAFGLLLAWLILRYLRGRRDIRLTNHLLIGITALLLLALIDTPFMSPSVLLSFFILFFTALRWADITRKRVDELDTDRPLLAVPPSKRKVPFHRESSNPARPS
jgi:O-antigen ligase